MEKIAENIVLNLPNLGFSKTNLKLLQAVLFNLFSNKSASGDFLNTNWSVTD